MGYETPDNPGVHERHGAALLEQHKTSDAVEKAYRPAKDALDAGDVGAARMQVQANRDT
jgi:hypothetical protein